MAGNESYRQVRSKPDTRVSEYRFADKKTGLANRIDMEEARQDDVVVDSLVMRSEEGGATWQRIAVPARGELYHLDYNGSSHAWIVGSQGIILASTDSGKTWKLQTSGVRLPLYNVDFRDDNEGYAVGKSGVILRTDNGGSRWERVITPFTDSLMRVDFADDKNGWVVGYKGTVLRSSDKGRNWISRSGATEHLYGLFMNKRSAGQSAKRLILQQPVKKIQIIGKISI